LLSLYVALELGVPEQVAREELLPIRRVELVVQVDVVEVGVGIALPELGLDAGGLSPVGERRCDRQVRPVLP
jgi:hypothetical protein